MTWFSICVQFFVLCKRDRKTLAECSCLPSSSYALWVASASIACVTLTSRLCISSSTPIMRANCCRRRDGCRCKVILLEQSLCACVCAHLYIYILIYAGWYLKTQHAHTHKHEHSQLEPYDGRWRCRTLETFRCPHEGRMPALQGLQTNQGFQKYGLVWVGLAYASIREHTSEYVAVGAMVKPLKCRAGGVASML